MPLGSVTFPCRFSVVAPAGTPAAQASNTVQANLPAAQYEDALRNGLPVHQEIELPPGQYELRIGVMDRASQKIGTVEAPVTAQAVSAAK